LGAKIIFALPSSPPLPLTKAAAFEVKNRRKSAKAAAFEVKNRRKSAEEAKVLHLLFVNSVHLSKFYINKWD